MNDCVLYLITKHLSKKEIALKFWMLLAYTTNEQKSMRSLSQVFLLYKKMSSLIWKPFWYEIVVYKNTSYFAVASALRSLYDFQKLGPTPKQCCKTFIGIPNAYFSNIMWLESDLLNFRGEKCNKIDCIPVFHRNDQSDCPYQGLSARARPTFGDALRAFESYSAETVISDFGLHSRCHSKPAFPLSEKRVFTTLNGSITWELPRVKLFS